MTYRQLHHAIDTITADYDARDDYTILGIRFENRIYNVGDICDPSRHNPDREDERDFPEYGTPEYDALEVLPGTSAYLIYHSDDFLRPAESQKWLPCGRDLDAEYYCFADHAYIIAGKRTATHSDADYGEVVLVDPTVVSVVF